MHDILSNIYSLYPKNLKYDSLDYLNSPQYLNWKNFMLKSCIPKEQQLLHSTIKKVFNKYYVKNFSSDNYWSFEFIVLLNKTDNVLDDDVELLKKLGGGRVGWNLTIPTPHRIRASIISAHGSSQIDSEIVQS